MAGAAAVAEPRSGLDRRTDLHSSGAARATDRALCTPSARSGGGALVAVDPATNELRAEYNPGRRGEPSLVVRARAFECEEWGADTVFFPTMLRCTGKPSDTFYTCLPTILACFCSTRSHGSFSVKPGVQQPRATEFFSR